MSGLRTATIRTGTIPKRTSVSVVCALGCGIDWLSYDASAELLEFGSAHADGHERLVRTADGVAVRVHAARSG
jgi:hypothetical protein